MPLVEDTLLLLFPLDLLFFPLDLFRLQNHHLLAQLQDFCELRIKPFGRYFARGGQLFTLQLFDSRLAFCQLPLFCYQIILRILNLIPDP